MGRYDSPALFETFNRSNYAYFNMHISLEHGAAFGPFVAGPEGVVLFEVMMGDPRSWPADTEGFERLLAEKGAKRLPNPPIELPDWLEDTRN